MRRHHSNTPRATLLYGASRALREGSPSGAATFSAEASSLAARLSHLHSLSYFLSYSFPVHFEDRLDGWMARQIEIGRREAHARARACGVFQYVLYNTR